MSKTTDLLPGDMSNRKHPRALPYLFFSEMWERFGYYLMIGIFLLYLKNVEHGFAMTNSEASDLYGTFIALVFLTPFIGGLLADRYFGYRRSIIAGGLMMGAGYCMMDLRYPKYLSASKPPIKGVRKTRAMNVP